MGDKNLIKFNRIDLSDYAGKALGIIDGKIAFNDPNPSKVMRWLMQQPKDKDVSLVCVPSSKTAMVL